MSLCLVSMCGLQCRRDLRDSSTLMLEDFKLIGGWRSTSLPRTRGRSVRRPVPLEKLGVRVALRMGHRDVKSEQSRLIPARVVLPSM